MNKRSLGALVALNVALLVALLAVTFGSRAVNAEVRRPPGAYLMVSGQAQGRTDENVVYIIETYSSKLVAIFFDSGTAKFTFVDGRVISNDLNAGGK